MFKSKNVLFTLLLSGITVLLIGGCNANQAKPASFEKKRSQKLMVRTSVNKAKEKVVQEYLTLNLDNVSQSTGIVSLENKGGQPLKIKSVSVDGKTSDLFERTTSCDNTIIQPGSKCKIEVSFVGKKAGYFEQVMTILSDDKRNKQTLIKIKAAANEITNAVLDSRTPRKKRSPNMELNFNKLNKSKYIEITQTGDKQLNIKKFKLSGKDSGSFVFSNNCPSILKVGEKCGITIDYDPSKKVGLSEASIKIVADGAIKPTSKIELRGRTEAYSVKILEYKVANNVKEFMDDYFTTNTKYFYRTMYQSDSDDELEKQIDDQMQAYFSRNNLQKAYQANDANKIINVFPRIKIEELFDGDKQPDGMIVNMGINGVFVTKSNYDESIDIKGKGRLVHNQDTNSTTFVAMTTEKEFVDKEEFSFFLKVKIEDYEDRSVALNRVAELMTQKLFNILGMADKKVNR